MGNAGSAWDARTFRPITGRMHAQGERALAMPHTPARPRRGRQVPAAPVLAGPAALWRLHGHGCRWGWAPATRRRIRPWAAPVQAHGCAGVSTHAHADYDGGLFGAAWVGAAHHGRRRLTPNVQFQARFRKFIPLPRAARQPRLTRNDARLRRALDEPVDVAQRPGALHPRK